MKDHHPSHNSSGDFAPAPTPLFLSAFDVLEMIPGVVFTFQLSDHRSGAMPYASAGLRDLIGLDPGDVKENAEAFLSKIDPEQIEPFFALAEESARTMTLWSLQLRIDHPVKKEVWIQWKARPVGQIGGCFWQGYMHDMTDARCAEESLARVAQDFINLAEGSPDSIIRYDLSGRILFLNSKLAKDLGVVAPEIINKLPGEVWSDGRFAAIDKAVKQAIENNTTVTVEFWNAISTPDAHFHHIHVAPEHDQSGKIVGAVAFGRDLTDFKRSARFLRTLINTLPDLIWLKNKEGVYLMCNARFERFFGASESAIVGKTDYDFVHTELADSFREHDRMTMEANAPTVNEEWVTFSDDGHRELLETIKVPMQDGTEAIGVLGIARNITEHKQVEESLWKSEQAFRSLAENSPENIIRYDLQCRQIYANPHSLEVLDKLLGRIPAGETPNEAHPDGSFREYEAALRRVLSTGCTEDFEFMLPDGGEGVQYHIIRMAAEKNERGEVVGGIAFGRDITAIRESEHRLRHFVDNLPGLAYTFRMTPDGKGVFPYVSAGVEELYGIKPEEAQGDMAPIHSRAHPEDRPVIEQAIARSSQTRTPLHIETRIAPPGLPERWLDVRSVPVVQSDGTLLWYGIMLDITQRKLAQQRLYLLEYAMERILDGSLLVDRGGQILDLNSALCNMLGYAKEELKGKAIFDISPDLTPENWNIQWEIIEAAGGAMQLETHHLTRDGRTIPTELSVSIFEFEAKSYNLAIIRNISERKEIEGRLRMAASVFEAAREGIAITDPRGVVLDINPAFSDISGYGRDEVLGKRPNLMASGQHDKAFYKALWTTLLREGVWSGEITNRRKNGELFIEHLSIMAVHDEAGYVKHYVGIFSDISLLKQHEQYLQHIAQHDALTDLPNRMLLTDRLYQGIAQAHRSAQMLAVLYIDLDSFKPINDSHGHEIGDRMLVEVARRLSESLRESDTVARMGGDEFVVLLSGISDVGECEFIVHRLLEIISRPFMLDGNSLNLTASIGISLYSDKGSEDADTLLRYADQAMYSAKTAGRNQFVFYDSSAQSRVRNYNQTIHDLRQALHENRISVYYQPIIDMATEQVIKAEALVRWIHPVLGMVPPSEFIPVAENGGLIHEIGDFVFREAARVAHTLNSYGSSSARSRIRISVNRSPRQFFHRNGVNIIKNFLNENDIPGELLVVEITEGLLLDDRPEVIQQLKQLHAMGIAISLDDFGTGYSALSYLRKFDIDNLKIDRSFIRDIVDDPGDRAIVESIIVMARRLGIQVIAEGVETRQQADILKAAGCDMAQGYFYARPMPEDEFLRFVMSFPGESS